MYAAITAIASHLPEHVLDNDALVREFPDWSVAKISAKTGIHSRHVVAPGETASDLGVLAARKLFDRGACTPDEIDFLLFCTQSPDHPLPTTACLVQHRLGLPTTAGALDFNLGCSGFNYGISLAKGLIETGQARCVLLVTAETYTRYLSPDDRGCRTIFGDGAAATLVRAVSDPPARGGPWIGGTLFGTDGAGGDDLVVRTGGARAPATASEPPTLVMRGPEIYSFTLGVVPDAVRSLLARTNETVDDIELFVFHQANEHMIRALQKSLRIADARFMVHLRDVGNTVSATIPIALEHAVHTARVKPGDRVVLVGFGVGASWGVTRIVWHG